MSLIRRILRDRRMAVASLLVVSLITTMLGPWLHADEGHDAEFARLVVHDASQHRLTADTTPFNESSAEQHCVACHFVRLVRDDNPVELATEPSAAGAGLAFDRSGHVVPHISGPPLPARAPPASSLA